MLAVSAEGASAQADPPEAAPEAVALPAEAKPAADAWPLATRDWSVGLALNDFGAAVEPIAGSLASMSFDANLDVLGPLQELRRVVVPSIVTGDSPGQRLVRVAERAEDLDLVAACRGLVAAFISKGMEDSCRSDVAETAVALTDGHFYVGVQDVQAVEYPFVLVTLQADSKSVSELAADGFERVAFEVYWSFDSDGEVYVETIMRGGSAYNGWNAWERLLLEPQRYGDRDFMVKNELAVTKVGDRVESVFEDLTLDPET